MWGMLAVAIRGALVTWRPVLERFSGRYDNNARGVARGPAR
jgi:hypothetical protein